MEDTLTNALLISYMYVVISPGVFAKIYQFLPGAAGVGVLDLGAFVLNIIKSRSVIAKIVRYFVSVSMSFVL